MEFISSGVAFVVISAKRKKIDYSVVDSLPGALRLGYDSFIPTD